MNNNLLYYPYIDIPNNNWTIKSLLYWDKVGIIVPPDFIEDPKQFKKTTIDLLQTDLIKQISPYGYTYGDRKFERGFIKLLDSPSFELEKKQEYFRNGKVSRIHYQKFGEELMEVLVRYRIATKFDYNWYHVESKTANLVMSYLAFYIGKKGDFLPSTDDVKNLDISLNQKGSILRTNKIRQNLLEDLMPYPLNADLTSLRKFKDKHHAELKSFRILLEQTAFEISIYKSSEKQKIIQDLKIVEIQDKKEKILKDLNQSKFKQIAFGTIFGVTGSVIGFAQGNSMLGAFSLINGLWSASQGYDNSSNLAKDFSYLALVDKNFK
jgi:hypothetical protein